MTERKLLEQALRAHRAGRLDKAKNLYKQVLAIEPRDPDALHLLGVATLQEGNANGAIELIEQAIRQQPGNPAFHGNLGQAYLAAERIPEAYAAFERAAALDPVNPQFATAAASCLALQGAVAEAERRLRAVTQQHPHYALAWLNLAHAVRDQGRLQEAVPLYRRAAELEPACAEAHMGLGAALHALGHFEEAERAYRTQLALEPQAEAAACNLASLLIDCGKFAEAASLVRAALARHRDSAELHWMLGSALAYQGRLAQALGAFRAASEISPQDARARWGQGLALLETGATEEGLAQLERASKLQPESADFHYGLAGVHLGLGNLRAGWAEHRWRPSRARFVEKLSGLALETDLPESLAGKKLCLLREQGLGDELFFLRFAPSLKARGAHLTYRAHPKIASILARVPALDRVIAGEEPLPAAEHVLLIGDLPLALRSDATPPPLPLVPLARPLEALRARLAGLGPPPYLGVSWRAGTAPEQQRGIAWGWFKEVPPARLGTALRRVRGTVLSLQRNPAAGETEQFAAAIGRPVHDFSAANEDLEEMLALLALLDDYIGVSNTNMHLRAGVGKTARVLVTRPHEWRWMLSGRESPWFPGFRIYRQGPDGEWDRALAELEQDLRTECGG